MNTLKFINRDRELNSLRNTLSSTRSEFIILYGRRRVGKTELLKHLLKEVDNSVYFTGRHETPHHLVTRLSRIISERVNDDYILRYPFRSFDEALEYITRNELVIAFDEFPYMVTTDPSIPSILQEYWDNKMKSSKVKMILCGSSIGMMERHLMKYSSPLYGRRTKQMKLEALHFSDISSFFPNQNITELIRIFGVLGGTPAYLLEYENDIFTTITKRILDKEEYLYRDVEFVLREELREPRYYFSILTSIASGRTKLSGIMDDTGLSRDITSKYLSVLTDLGIIQRTIPITENTTSRKGLYKIRDNYFRFWFRYVYQNLDLVELGNIPYVLEMIHNDFPNYMGKVFEEIVVQVFQRTNAHGVFPFIPTRIGGWWDKNEEIDIVALDERTGDIGYGEVKFQKRKVGLDILNELKRKSNLIQKVTKRHEYYLLVSRSGFKKNLIEHKGDNVILMDLKDFENHMEIRNMTSTNGM